MSVDAVSTARRSRRPYFVASLIVLVMAIALLALVGWYTEPDMEGGQIIFHVPDEILNSSSGDPFYAYDRYLYVPISGMAVLFAIVLAVTLGIVNGLIFCLRR